MLKPIYGRNQNRRIAQKTEVAMSKDHMIHLLVDFDSERLDVPYTPDQAEQLAAMLLRGAAMARGAGNLN